ncbi:MAG: NAD(P)H-dependent oxidoreductase subunit E [Victivallales bacterium]|nr:NAD(P)H-dependent oxidoreductase subunit E [Victivallales bacterium]
MGKFFYLKEIEKQRCNLIKGLQLVQGKESYISNEAISVISSYFSVPEAEVEGVVSFYAQFKRIKPGKYRISVCDGTACHIKGSKLILDWITTELGIADGETDKIGFFSIETVACLGCCSLAPVLSINGKVYGKLDRKKTIKILREYRKNG